MRTVLAIAAALLVVVIALALPLQDAFEIRAGRSRTIETSIRDLGADSFDRRERATRRLLSLGEAARADLRAAAESPEMEIRRRARAILDALDLRRLPLSERRLPAYRRIIFFGLGRDGAFRPGTPRYTALSLDPGVAARAASDVARRVEADPLRHERAVRLLRDMNRPESAPYLASLLARGRGLAAALNDATETLIRVGGPAEVPDLRIAADARELPVPRRFALRALAALGGREDLPIVREATRARDARVRAEAARTLAFLGRREAVDDLLGLLADEDGPVRRAALEGLGGIPTDDFRAAALESQSDEDPGVRQTAARIIGLRGTPGDALWIRRALSDVAPRVRAEALRAIARLRDATEAARIGLHDCEPCVRRVALEILAVLPEDTRSLVLSEAPPESDPWLTELRKGLATH